MEKKISDSLTFAMFCIFVGGFLLGGYVSVIVKNEQIQDIRAAYEMKLASKELQVKLTQSSYDECNKRYTEPRPIVCN